MKKYGVIVIPSSIIIALLIIGYLLASNFYTLPELIPIITSSMPFKAFSIFKEVLLWLI